MKTPKITPMLLAALSLTFLSVDLTLAQPSLQNGHGTPAGRQQQAQAPLKGLGRQSDQGSQAPATMNRKLIEQETRVPTRADSNRSLNQKLIDGNSNGGGGHFCKSQANLFYENINAAFNEDPALAEAYPEWSEMRKKLDPKQNPGFVIKITKSPIQSCPNTENALACGRPRQNVIELYCGENGFNSLGAKEKYKQLIHELYWWTSLDDTNYHYSAKMVNDLFEKIRAKSIATISYLRLKQGEITSAETVLNKISLCQASNQLSHRGLWVQNTSDGTWECVGNENDPLRRSCFVGGAFTYSIIINQQYVIQKSYNSDQSYFGNLAPVPLGSVFSEKLCKEALRKTFFNDYSMTWLRHLADIQAGDLNVNQTGSQRTCYKKVFEATFDSATGEVVGDSIDRKLAPCP